LRFVIKQITCSYLYFVVITSCIVYLVIFCRCSSKVLDRELIPPDQIKNISSDGSSSESSQQQHNHFLKIHMKNGAVYVLSPWIVDTVTNSIRGKGKLLDISRQVVDEGDFIVAIDSAVIFETNKIRPSGAIAPMTIITSISLAITAFCITNPKACFGSCPTIYTQNGESDILQAEGFSASIAPSLEATDIDILNYRVPNEQKVQLHVKNEALETHIIRSMDLIVIKRDPNTRIFRGIDTNFYQTYSSLQPKLCLIGMDDYVGKVSHLDCDEYFSTSNQSDLSVKEIVELRFDHLDCDSVGLVIGCRQSLLSTYLLYTGLGYLGNQVGDWIAKLERGDTQAMNSAGNIGRILGGIEVMIEQSNGEFRSVGTVNETGPLATDVHVVPLPSQENGNERTIKLRLTKGHWRIDFLALVCLNKTSSPICLSPSEVFHNDIIDIEAKRKLLDSTMVLTTFPGDEYRIGYDLPDFSENYEIFIKSRGYYIEWIRDEWIAEENMVFAAEMFFSPQKALKRLAPEFKEVEEEMENVFWNSKYVK